MKLVVQRVINAKVDVDNKTVGKIENGFMVLVGFTENDTDTTIDKMIQKLIRLRIFDDENGIMNKSILDIKGSVLSISQFTLYADTKKGNRPSYTKALGGDKAIILYEKFNYKLSEFLNVETGIFGAEMQVSLTNDGPVTIILDSEG